MSVSELVNILVLKLGLDPEYVLDRMRMYEAKSYMEYSHYREQDSWEQARLISYVQAQTQSSKKLKVTDIMRFPWEKDYKPEVMSDKDWERLKMRADALSKIINNE